MQRNDPDYLADRARIIQQQEIQKQALLDQQLANDQKQTEAFRDGHMSQQEFDRFLNCQQNKQKVTLLQRIADAWPSLSQFDFAEAESYGKEDPNYAVALQEALRRGDEKKRAIQAAREVKQAQQQDAAPPPLPKKHSKPAPVQEQQYNVPPSPQQQYVQQETQQQQMVQSQPVPNSNFQQTQQFQPPYQQQQYYGPPVYPQQPSQDMTLLTLQLQKMQQEQAELRQLLMMQMQNSQQNQQKSPMEMMMLMQMMQQPQQQQILPANDGMNMAVKQLQERIQLLQKNIDQTTILQQNSIIADNSRQIDQARRKVVTPNKHAHGQLQPLNSPPQQSGQSNLSQLYGKQAIRPPSQPLRTPQQVSLIQDSRPAKPRLGMSVDEIQQRNQARWRMLGAISQQLESGF